MIVEPQPKNTAICALIAALTAQRDGYSAVMLLPSDHYVSEYQEYIESINQAFNFVSEFGICTLGIPITNPSTEFGYIKIGRAIKDNIYHTRAFIEKPCLLDAQKYLQQGGYFWNSGIFIYNIEFMLSQAQKFQPALLTQASEALHSALRDGASIQLLPEAYDQVNAISIDHGIIQHIPTMIMVKSDFQWYDFGNWQTLWATRHKDQDNNYCEGNVVLANTTNSYISVDKKFTAVVGLDNMVIINIADALFIADKSKISEIKNIANKIIS